jgi:hypothetical protein
VESPEKIKYVYQAPVVFVGLFYAVLTTWTAICVPLLGLKAVKSEWANLMQWIMIGFVLAYTWYFSLAISYKIEADSEGGVELKSFRRVLKLQAEDISMLEPPHLPIGFFKFRLAREKAYLFCTVNNSNLQQVLKMIKTSNPDVKLKGL